MIQEKPKSVSPKLVHVPDSTDWRELKYGLFMSPGGVIGYASNPALANFKRSELQGERCANRFITFVNDGDDTLSLSAVIDTATFEMLGTSCFYRDKNRIYNYYAMCEGGYLTVFGNEPKGIKVMGSYAAYKGKIYHDRNGLMDADYKTFRTSDEVGPSAKDKNGYFMFEDRVTEEEIRNSLPAEMFAKLKEL